MTKILPLLTSNNIDTISDPSCIEIKQLLIKIVVARCLPRNH